MILYGQYYPEHPEARRCGMGQSGMDADRARRAADAARAAAEKARLAAAMAEAACAEMEKLTPLTEEDIDTICV